MNIKQAIFKTGQDLEDLNNRATELLEKAVKAVMYSAGSQELHFAADAVFYDEEYFFTKLFYDDVVTTTLVDGKLKEETNRLLAFEISSLYSSNISELTFKQTMYLLDQLVFEYGDMLENVFE